MQWPKPQPPSHRQTQSVSLEIQDLLPTHNKTNMLIFIGWIGLVTAGKLILDCVVWLCWSGLATSEKCERTPVFPFLSPPAIQPQGSGKSRPGQKLYFHQIESERRLEKRDERRRVSCLYPSSPLEQFHPQPKGLAFHGFHFLSFQHASWWHHDWWLTDNLSCDVI